MKTLAALRFAASCSILACGSAAGGSDEHAESELRIRPTLGAGELSISVPADMTAPYGIEVMRTGGAWQRATVGVSTLPIGAYCVRTIADGNVSGTGCGFEVRSRARTEVQLGAVELVRSRGETLHGVDIEQRFGTNPLLGVRGRFPHPAGTFEYVAVPANDNVGFTVAAGATTTVDLNERSGRATLRVVPDASTLPLYKGAVSYGLRVGFDSYTTLLPSLEAPILLRGRAGQRVLVEAVGSSSLTLVSASMALTTSTEVRLAALEVDHVAYQQPAGTVDIAGKFNVLLGDKTVLAGIPTGYAVHLLPASYRVVVTYRVPGAPTDSVDEYAADLR